MKYIKAKKGLIFILSPILLLIGIFLFCFTSQAIINFFYAFWICLACALFLIVTPFGNKKLANELDTTPRMHFLHWFLRIIIIELLLIGVYAGISALCGELFPINAAVNKHLFSESLQTELLHFGLFPWSLYGLIAAGMGIIAYRKQDDAYFSNLIQPFTKQNPQGTISVIVNIGARRCVQFILSIALLFMTLLLISLFLSLPLHVAHGFQTVALFTTLILLMLVYTKKIKQYINSLFSRHIPTIYSFPIFCIVLGVTILILTLIFSASTQHTAAQSYPNIILRWMEYNNATAWKIFSVMWWICLTPLVSGFIARISKGYKIRDILLCTLALPIIISLYFIFSHSASIALPLFAIKILSIISFLILLPVLINHDNSSNAILSYFPKNGIGKPRDEQIFFQRAVQFCILSFYLYLVIGINGLSLFIFAINYGNILSLLVICVGVCFV
ncbi:MAG TPA: BCCT family transporter [Coxiellaceae bacterium]|nr:MAG: hypothetical protein A3E81_02695 [Gammaproteobacteria bacterium RIFCSPHIGHO2_12_FULL_36_30]HLB56223.1 BCCT family transporter [Coxiellaceae bacterium]